MQQFQKKILFFDKNLLHQDEMLYLLETVC